MKLRELLEGLEYRCVEGDVDKEIFSVVYDSKKLAPGCVFVCIVGAK